MNPFNGMDLVTLRLLLAAKDEGNLARVAERENIAISAVSRRITEFEQRYALPMFERHDRGVTPTPDGIIVLDRIAAVVEQLGQVAGDLIERRDGTAGIVRMRAHMSAAVSGQLPMRIRAFLDAHPGVEIELDEGTSLDIVKAVRAGVCEVGLISGTVDGKGLELVPWAEDELVALVPADSDLCRRASLSLIDLTGEPFIGMQRDSALLSLYRGQAAAMNRTLIERVHAMSFESVRACVSAGLGVAILPATAAYPHINQGSFEVRRLTDSWAHRPLMLCHRRDAKLSATSRALVKHLCADRLAGTSESHGVV